MDNQTCSLFFFTRNHLIEILLYSRTIRHLNIHSKFPKFQDPLPRIAPGITIDAGSKIRTVHLRGRRESSIEHTCDNNSLRGRESVSRAKCIELTCTHERAQTGKKKERRKEKRKERKEREQEKRSWCVGG